MGGASSRIVLLGATGSIGRPLVQSLMEPGAELVVVTRDPDKARRIFGESVAPVAWDGRSQKSLWERVDGARAVVNLAGENLAKGRWTNKRKRVILDSRRLSGRAVVEAIQAARRRPEVLIQASAVGFYGSRDDEILDEASPAGSGFLSAAVLDWESTTRDVETLGVRRVVIRTGMVLGREGGALPPLARPFRFFVGGPIGSGRQWLSWIHLTDEVRAIQFLLNDGRACGVYNLVSPHPLREKDFARAVGRALGRPHLFKVPGFVLRWLFGEKAEETLLVSQRIVPRRLEESGFVFSFSDAQSALDDLLKKPRAEK
jgi:uncharacterized protein (TIGR01777 family)